MDCSSTLLIPHSHAENDQVYDSVTSIWDLSYLSPSFFFFLFENYVLLVLLNCMSVDNFLPRWMLEVSIPSSTISSLSSTSLVHIFLLFHRLSKEDLFTRLVLHTLSYFSITSFELIVCIHDLINSYFFQIFSFFYCRHYNIEYFMWRSKNFFITCRSFTSLYLFISLIITNTH